MKAKLEIQEEEEEKEEIRIESGVDSSDQQAAIDKEVSREKSKKGSN